MNLKTIAVDRLKPAPYNPRIPLTPGMPEYSRLERSIKEFDLVQPIVWNEQTSHVVAGHQRLEVLKNQGVQQVEVVVVSLTLEREKALNVTLNNPQVGSDWDAEKLVDLLGELNELEDFDATLTGFDANDINDLLLAPTPIMPDEMPQPCSKPMVRVTIEIPPERWEAVRAELDELIASQELTVHIKLPTGH